MAYSQTKVTATIETPDGRPAANARVEAKLDTADIERGQGFVVPSPVVATTNGSGQVSFNLWPNTEGYAGTQYQIIIRAASGQTLTSGTVVVPDVSGGTIPLSDIWETAPNAPVAMNNRLVSEAHEYRNDARNFAGAAATSAEEANSSATSARSARTDVFRISGEINQSAIAASESAEASAESASASAASAKRAQASEDTAGSRAAAAESSASTAQSAVSSAKRNADDAASSRTKSEEAAARSRDSADQAESSATKSFDEAKNAADSANSADGAAQRSSESAGKAANSATDASNSASLAARSASDVGDVVDRSNQAAAGAERSADNAKESSDRASGFATTAKEKADDASTAASSARTASTSAGEARDVAQSQAKAAAESATESDTRAKASASSAATAGSRASAAKTSADDAKTAASDARDNANESKASADASAEHAEAAAASATSADTSSRDAIDASTQASEAVNQIGDSLANAENAAAQAGDSAAKAHNDAEQTAQDAQASATSRQAAETAQQGAEQAANNASSSATEAAQSAQDAGNSASTAGTSADRASSAADNAEREVTQQLSSVGIGDSLPTRRTSENSLADQVNELTQFWYYDDAGETPWPDQYVLVSVAGREDGVSVQQVMYNGDSLAVRIYENATFSDWDVLLEAGMVPSDRIPSFPASRLEGDIPAALIPGLDAEDDTVEKAGTAQSLMDEHLQAADPHQQYATKEAVDEAIGTLDQTKLGTDTFDQRLAEIQAEIEAAGGNTAGGPATGNLLLNADFFEVNDQGAPRRWTTNASAVSRVWENNAYQVRLAPPGTALRFTGEAPQANRFGGRQMQFTANVRPAEGNTAHVLLRASGRSVRYQLSEESARLLAMEFEYQVSDPDTFSLTPSVVAMGRSALAQRSTGPDARYAAQTASDGRYVYVFGGRGSDGFDWFNNTSAKSDLWRYDPEDDTWLELPSTGVPGPLSGGAMVHFNGALYVVFGTPYRQNNNNEAQAQANTWRYDLESQEWSELSALPRQGYWPGAAVGDPAGMLDGHIVTCGGLSNGNHRNVDLYDIANDNWTALGQMPYAANNVGVAIIGDLIYLFGGYTSGNWRREMYSGRVQQNAAGDGIEVVWTRMKDMGTGRTTFGYAADIPNRRIFINGGNGNNGVMEGTEVYDIDADEWSSTVFNGPGVVARFSASTVVGGVCYDFGGWTGSSALSSLRAVVTVIGVADGDDFDISDAALSIAAPPSADIFVSSTSLEPLNGSSAAGLIYVMTGEEYDALDSIDPNGTYIVERT